MEIENMSEEKRVYPEEVVRFGGHLRELRNDKHLSQREVAALLGVGVSTYANWEQGRREPSISDILQLIAIFEIDANELFETD